MRTELECWHDLFDAWLGETGDYTRACVEADRLVQANRRSNGTGLTALNAILEGFYLPPRNAVDIPPPTGDRHGLTATDHYHRAVEDYRQKYRAAMWASRAV